MQSDGWTDDLPTTEIELPNGSHFLVRPDGADAFSGEQDIAAAGELEFQDFLASVGELGASVRDTVTRLAPDRAKVEFGVSVAVNAGKLTAMLVDAHGSCDMRLTLEWTGDRDD